MKDWLRFILVAGFVSVLFLARNADKDSQVQNSNNDSQPPWGYDCVGNTVYNPSTQFCEKPSSVVRQVPITPVARAPSVVARAWWGGCPRGYENDPRSPERCVLPILAARMLANAGRPNERVSTPQDDNTAALEEMQRNIDETRGLLEQQAYEAESERSEQQRLKREVQEAKWSQ